MNLIVIYGPPASGKLAVARELSRITGYGLFHNHLTIELLRPIVSETDPEYLKLRDRYRRELIDIAARKGLKGVIFTYAYGGTRGEDQLLKSLQKIVSKYKGKTHFVRLQCTIGELRRRVVYAGRGAYGKMADVKSLDAELHSRNVFAEVPFAGSFSIDNTRMLPSVVASRIRSHPGL